MCLQNWVKNGTLFLKDIVNGKGSFVSFQSFKKRHHIQETFLDYEQLKHNTPKDWLAKLARTLAHRELQRKWTAQYYSLGAKNCCLHSSCSSSSSSSPFACSCSPSYTSLFSSSLMSLSCSWEDELYFEIPFYIYMCVRKNQILTMNLLLSELLV